MSTLSKPEEQQVKACLWLELTQDAWAYVEVVGLYVEVKIRR
jgi:hypothetical protein